VQAVSSPGEALERLGWDERFAALAREVDVPAAAPGRVSRVDRGLVTVLTAHGTVRALPATGAVATGDWVMVDDAADEPAIVAVLPRRSAFVRGDPMEGAARGAQVVAANVDTVFVVQALDTGPNLRRLERELVLVYDSGALPVVVLNKADVVAATEDAEAAVRSVAPGVDLVVTSSVTGAGMADLSRHTRRQHTVALIGASGVGKSTLVNRIVGVDVQDTGAVRATDRRGRHTTTARELIPLPGGGVLIDTPGLRAVSLWDSDEGFGRAFADIEALAEGCRFSDCAHRSEPGCAVRAAVDEGALHSDRLEHYLRLDRELDATARRREARAGSKALRDYYKRR
jgi:ribosome biogenesis GTPase / thiamine phosphate phosphatase